MGANVMPLTQCRDICLATESDEALYQQLYHEIRSRILNRRFISGMRLPSSRELAKELKICRNTVMQALLQLQTEGYLEAKAGSGVFVSALIPDDYLHAEPRYENRCYSTAAPNSKLVLSHYAIKALSSTDCELVSNKIFASGIPAMDAFPHASWLKIWHQQLRNVPSSMLKMNSAAGLSSLQQALCNYLRYSRAVHCQPEQVIITNGAQQALDLICRVFINPGDAAVVEEPGYLGMRKLLQSMAAEIISCSVDHQGLKVSELPRCNKKQIKLIYTTPTHQYPLGGIMPVSRRLKLLEWAHKHNTYLIEDDYDGEYHYASKPLPSLHSLDKHHQVLYVGSLSKVLSPLLRLGYLVIPQQLVPLFAKIKRIASGATEPVKQAVVAEFIQSGNFCRHLKRMRLLYAKRMQWVVFAAQEQLSEWLQIGLHDAGMHLVLTFKHNMSHQVLVEKLKQRNCAAKALSIHYINKPQTQGLILGFAHMPQPDIIKGIAAIRQCMLKHALP